MDYPKSIVWNQKEIPISIQKVKGIWAVFEITTISQDGTMKKL